jgi:hypothetical protein
MPSGRFGFRNRSDSSDFRYAFPVISWRYSAQRRPVRCCRDVLYVIIYHAITRWRSQRNGMRRIDSICTVHTIIIYDNDNMRKRRRRAPFRRKRRNLTVVVFVKFYPCAPTSHRVVVGRVCSSVSILYY